MQLFGCIYILVGIFDKLIFHAIIQSILFENIYFVVIREGRSPFAITTKSKERMKQTCLLVILLFLFGCNQPKVVQEEVFTAEDTISVDTSITQRITVYGDVHALLNERVVPEEVQQIQRWLCDNISEEIVVAEGVPYGDSVTIRSLIAEIKAEAPEITDAQILERLTSLNEVNNTYFTSFLLKGNKLLFGGENDSLYTAIGNLEDRTSPANVNARSRAIFLNAVTIARKYPTQKIAIVIGRRHLSWFSCNGIKTIDPKK